MKPSVYVETSVISYLAARQSRDVVMAGRQAESHDWWSSCRQRFDVYVSSLVEEEIRQGNAEQAALRKALIDGLDTLGVSDEAVRLAEKLLAESAIPAGSGDDALHVGIAASHGMEYLVSWNFKHINNVMKRSHIVSVVEQFGRRCPIICTPSELGGG